ncbi:UPF0109 protein [Pullulanibacillus camelliae]|uniref:RNA-binding protein KhpA n=1 Tax=Pullulanibacillus camelliae TaxID=1707096 RepID=A0A8J2W2C8_9BACL|nr:KH domain-containing protein [Pullulanibacillus camelliae]GGE41973.1 UPF0109 protein [Pullulanibacillus camelliae]
MDELIKAVVCPLVDYPEDVRIIAEQEASRVNYTLSVNKEDMGKVIGKHGRTASAIRSVVHAAGLSHQENVTLTIQE